jgi:hypothetical protein
LSVGGEPTGKVERVILAQTPVDAMAIGVMEAMPAKRTMYLSADGVLPTAFLQGFSPEQTRVAMNRDELGQRLAEEAREGLPNVRQVNAGGAGLGADFAGGAGAIDSAANAEGAIGFRAIGHTVTWQNNRLIADRFSSRNTPTSVGRICHLQTSVSVVSRSTPTSVGRIRGGLVYSAGITEHPHERGENFNDR